MNKTSTDKIRSAALFLIRFRRCLPQPTQSLVRPYLDQPYQLALNILDCCSVNQLLTMAEIAQQTGVTRETVRQVLQALKEGGTALEGGRRGWQLRELPSECDPNLAAPGCETLASADSIPAVANQAVDLIRPHLPPAACCLR